MIFVHAFLLSGVACLIAQVILDNSKLTPGHITSLFVVVGSILSFLGVYPWLIDKCGTGATILISNFGNSLYTAGLEGFHESGLLGIFSGLLTKASLPIVAAIVFSFIFTLIFRPRD